MNWKQATLAVSLVLNLGLIFALRNPEGPGEHRKVLEVENKSSTDMVFCMVKLLPERNRYEHSYILKVPSHSSAQGVIWLDTLSRYQFALAALRNDPLASPTLTLADEALFSIDSGYWSSFFYVGTDPEGRFNEVRTDAFSIQRPGRVTSTTSQAHPHEP